MTMTNLKRPSVSLYSSTSSLCYCFLFPDTLYLDNNELSGVLPDELFSLTSILSLRLSNNTLISGEIPESIGNANETLKQLIITNTSLGGNLPDQLFSLGELTNLDLAYNSFSGTLSEDFGLLQKLLELRLNDNLFTGAIPTTFEEITLRKCVSFPRYIVTTYC